MLYVKMKPFEAMISMAQIRLKVCTRGNFDTRAATVRLASTGFRIQARSLAD